MVRRWSGEIEGFQRVSELKTALKNDAGVVDGVRSGVADGMRSGVADGMRSAADAVAGVVIGSRSQLLKKNTSCTSG